MAYGCCPPPSGHQSWHPWYWVYPDSPHHVGITRLPLLVAGLVTEFSLFTHHAWIGGFFIVGSGAHAALFLVSDYSPGALRGVERLLAHRHSVIAPLNWVSIFLGCHAFGMYIHNDTLGALGRQDDLFSDEGIRFRPVLGLLAQAAMTTEGVTSPAGTFIGTRLTGTADLLVHHIHAFTIHVTALILVKGVLFACLGCHLPLKLETPVQCLRDRGEWLYVFAIDRWLRDFLWSEASQVIQSYRSPGSAYGLLFLGAHFIWAFSLMFLFSGRGYE